MSYLKSLLVDSFGENQITLSQRLLGETESISLLVEPTVSTECV